MNKYYLSELLEKRGIDVLEMASEKNILIVSPTGSGKTYFIMNDLCNDDDKKYLYLCDNRNLKEQVMTNDNTVNSRGEMLNKDMELSKKFFGKKNIVVMTYAEFGLKLLEDKISIEQYDVIIADEVHNLIEYFKIKKDVGLKLARIKLFKKYNNTKIIAFTATPQPLDELTEKETYVDKNFFTYDFRKDKEIKRYTELVKDTFGHYKQIPTIINKFKDAIIFKGMKVLIYAQQIETMKTIESLLSELGYLKTICIWSINNEDDRVMLEEQLKVRKHLLHYGELMNPYNVLIINDATETGVNIYDKDMMYCIINSTNEVTQEQIRGRIRHDIIQLTLKEDRKLVTKDLYNLDEKWLNRPLTKEDKDSLCEELNIFDSKGRLVKWTTVKKMLEQNGYTIKDKTTTNKETKKNLKVSIINK